MTFAAPSSSCLLSGRQAANQVALASRRLQVRPMGRDDVERIYEVNCQLDRRYLSAPPLDKEGLDELRHVFEGEWLRHGLGYLVVCHDDDTVGHVRLKHIADCTSGRAAEVIYAIAPAFRDRGYATEAVAMVLAFAFEEAGVDYVVACVEPDNEASVRVAEKNGFALVATGRVNGRVMRRYVLPQSMWLAQRRALSSLRAQIVTEL
jgi:RimJ/RimL family protein N-acetyltransferase